MTVEEFQKAGFSEKQVEQFKMLKEGGFSDTEIADHFEKSEKSSVGKAISSIPESARQYGENWLKGIGGMVPWSPTEGFRYPPTLRNMADMAQHPIQTFKYFKNRLWDNAQETFENDPVGMLGDISAPFSAGGGILGKLGGTTTLGKVGRGLSTIGKWTDPINVLESGPKALIERTGVPDKMLGSAYGFNKKLQPKESAKLLETITETKALPTRRGSAKLEKQIGGLTDQKNAIIDDPANKNIPLNLETVMEPLKGYADKIIETATDPKEEIVIRNKIKNFAEQISYAHNGSLEVQSGQKMVRAIGEKLENLGFWKNLKEGKPIASNQYKVIMLRGEAAIREGITNAIIEQIPEAAALNKKSSKRIELRKVIDAQVGKMSHGMGFRLRDFFGGMITRQVTGSDLLALAAVLGSHIKEMPAVKAKIGIELKSRHPAFNATLTGARTVTAVSEGEK